MQQVDLRRGRMILTRPTQADAERIAEMCQDASVQEWTTIPSPYRREDADAFLENLVGPGWAAQSPIWALRLLSQEPGNSAGGGDVRPVWDEPVRRGLGDLSADDVAAATLYGMVGLTDLGEGRFEVGYWLAPEARGRGLMTGAVDAVLDVAADDLDAQVVRWGCLVKGGQPNWESWRVAWRLGFAAEGVKRLAFRQRGVLHDEMTAAWVPGEPRRPVEPWRGPMLLGETPIPPRPDSRDPEALVRQFHTTYGLPIVDDAPDVDRERVHMRMALIAEEFAELMGAVYGGDAETSILDVVRQAVAGDDGTRDTVETADALADLIYVIYGMALEIGVPLADVLAEVQVSNLSKLGADGKPIYRDDGKVLKGPGFRDPQIARVLRAVKNRLADKCR